MTDQTAAAAAAATTATNISNKDNNIVMTVEPTSSSLSGNSAVDNAFERLFGYKFGTTFDLPEGGVEKENPVPAPEPAKKKKKKSSSSSTALQLIEIFGRTRAARILGNITTRKRPLSSSSSSITGTDDHAGSSSSNKRSRRIINYKDIELPQTNKQKTVTETKVFAGQTIQTTTTVAAATASKPAPSTATPTAAAAASAGNLDQVLSQINGPSKMNTVEKTSNDWEQLKETDQQLKEELEKKAQGKDAFLVKQDFLNRVDQRKFELEREERDRERAKRNTAS